MARTPWPGTVVDGEIASADDFNSGPGGIVEKSSPVTTDTTGIAGTTTDLTGCSVTATLAADRLYTVRGFVPRFASDTADDAIWLYIREGSTVIQSKFADMSSRTDGSSGGNGVDIETVPFTPTAGSHTYKLSVVRATGGSGVITTDLSSAAPAFIYIRDEGPAF